MVVLGMEIYRVIDLPKAIQDGLPSNCKDSEIVVKKIVQNSPIRIEWEPINSSPSEWLMKDFPQDLVKE